MTDKRLTLYTPEEIKEQDKKANLFEAIVEFMLLDNFFSESKYQMIGTENQIPAEVSREYYPLETLFKNRCDKKRESNPTLSIEVFAISEKKRIEGIIEKVESLSDKTYYSEHPTYIQALEYIEFLSEFLNSKSKSNTLEGFGKAHPVKYSTKYYAWYHRILIELKKADKFKEGDKNGIKACGNKYNAKSGFYQAFIDFNIESLEKKVLFVKSLSEREKLKWKSIIIEISNNDADVIYYLNNFLK